MTPTPGIDTLDRFQLEARVGRGATAEVFRARDREVGTTVALKRLHAHLVGSPVAERFRREARILERIRSPHVVRYVAHGTDEAGRDCLVMEWLEGEDLGRRQRRSPLSPRLAVEVIRQAALGLHALHDAGVVHRDVKPANFIIEVPPAGAEEAGLRLRLVDLGVARTHDEATMTVEGMLLGTPSYMSPEQARGDLRITPRSDVFSLGAVLFELITGKRPFVGDDLYAVLARIVLQDPPRLMEAAPDTEPALDEICALAMAKEVDARFPTARAFAEALARLPPPASDRAPPSVGHERTHISAAREQRVITAVFAAFWPGGHAETGVDLFGAVAAEHGGWVERTLGRRAMAVFGAESSRGDEAVRAARVALEVVAKNAGGRSPQLAIVTGQAVAGGAALSGRAIDRGAREVELAAPGRVRLDEPTARLLAAHFVVEGPRRARVLGRPRGAIEPVAPRLLGRASPLVGRAREVEMLQSAFLECKRESVARAVIVTGAAGVGKSRLRYELLDWVGKEHPDATLLMGRGDSLSAGSPFGMVAMAMRRLVGILGGEPASRQRSRLEAEVAAHLPEGEVGRVCAYLGELISAGTSGQSGDWLASARLNPQIMGDGMRSSWEQWLGARLERAPVLVVLEDLHWGDWPSVHFIDGALRQFSDRRLMVLALARPELAEVFPNLWVNRNPEHRRLAPLSRRHAEELVRSALGDGLDASAVSQIVERADGNAFFLEEIIRAHAEGGDQELPATVLGTVQARLDSFGSEAKRLLRAASVFGQTFWYGGVRALAGSDHSTVSAEDSFAGLLEREIILQRPVPSLPGETEYVFRHAIVRDAAYDMLTQEDRAVGHRLAGEWLESRGYPDAFVLAEHFHRGNEPQKAVGWYHRAAEQALEGNDLASAISRAERGLESGAAGEVRGALHLILAEALRWRGELAGAHGRAVEAMGDLTPGGALWLRAVGERVASAGLLGRVDDVDRAAAEVNALPPPAERLSGYVACLCRAAIPLLWAGRHAVADPLFERIDELVAGASGLDAWAEGLVHFTRATRALHAGDPETHLNEQLAAHRCFEASGDVRNACSRRIAVGFAHCELGCFEEAEAALLSARDDAERLGMHNLVVRADNNLGNVLAMMGRLEEARSVEERAVESAIAQGDPRIEAMSRFYLSRILLASGDAASALDQAERAVRLAETAPSTRAVALAAEARALVALGRVEEALAASTRAAELLEQLGRLDEGESYVRLVHAETLGAAGRADEARAAWARAQARLTERASRIRDPRLQVSFLDRAPDNRATRAHP